MPKRKVTVSNSESDAVMDIELSAADNTIEIKSAQLKDDFCNYSYEFKVAENTTDTINRKSSLVVHDDLKRAFKKLHPHLAVICEEIDHKSIKDIDRIPEWDPDKDYGHVSGMDMISLQVSHFSVSAFKLEGTGENAGVVLIGQKRLSTGEYVKLETPRTTWDDDYPFIHDLRVAIDDLVVEVEEYMKGKSAPRLVQTEMEFEDDENTEE